MKIRHTPEGKEIVDNTPVEMPLGFKKPESLEAQIQRLVRVHLSESSEKAGFESFEDSEDFDIEDDPLDPSTPYELEFDPLLGREVNSDMLRRDGEKYKAEYMKAAKADPRINAAIEKAQEKQFWKKFWSKRGDANSDGPSSKARPSELEDPRSEDANRFGQEQPRRRDAAE